MLTPVPCSAFSDPSYLPSTSSTSLPQTTHSARRPRASRSPGSMKWRFPAEVWPATPVRKGALRAAPGCPRHSAIRAGGTHTSSMIRDVPGSRSLPIRPCRPSHYPSSSPRLSRVAVNVWSPRARAREELLRVRLKRVELRRSSLPRTRPASAAEAGQAPSTAPACPDRLGRDHQEPATISSTAVAPPATRSGTGSVPPRSRGSGPTQGGLRRQRDGSKVRPAMNASVPSEPTSTRRKISSGVSASRKAQSRYPVVFLISNSRGSARDSASARISSRTSSSPVASSGSARRSRLGARIGGVDLVPEAARTQRRTVEYESGVTPQRMPPELLATTPPTQAMSRAGGVGAELARARGEHPVRMPQQGSGANAGAGPVAERLHPDRRRTSTMIPSPWAWPLRLVPAAWKPGCSAPSRSQGLRHVLGVAGCTPPSGRAGTGLASEA